MGKAKRTRKFATMKRMISASDPRLKDKDRAAPKKQKKDDDKIKTTEAPATSSALFFQVTNIASLLSMPDSAWRSSIKDTNSIDIVS